MRQSLIRKPTVTAHRSAMASVITPVITNPPPYASRSSATVTKTAANEPYGRSGRMRDKVEGLVIFMDRGGSNPLGRI